MLFLLDEQVDYTQSIIRVSYPNLSIQYTSIRKTVKTTNAILILVAILDGSIRRSVFIFTLAVGISSIEKADSRLYFHS